MGRVKLACGGVLLGAMLLLSLPLRWLAAAAVSITVHEMCHYLALRLCHVPVYRLTVAPGHLVLHTGEMSRAEELFCSLAGPAGGLCLLILCRRMPRLALCALVHSGCNLLPIFPLDGGRAARCLRGMLRKKAER